MNFKCHGKQKKKIMVKTGIEYHACQLFEVIEPIFSASHSKKKEIKINKRIRDFLWDDLSYKFRKITAIQDGINPYKSSSGKPSLFVPISKISKGAAIVISTIQTK